MKTTTKSPCGTSFHDTTIHASVKELISVLGEPDYKGNSGEDKVNFEWVRETEDSKIFTVYDYKEYRKLKKNEIIEWHIGGNNMRDTEKAKNEILELM